MGFVIRILLVLAIWGISAVIFEILSEFDLEHWLGYIVVLGLVLPWGVDLLQGNQVNFLRGDYGKGVCDSLQKDAYVVALFVNDRESTWTEDEIENYMEYNIKDSLTYIETQAQNYGQNTSLELGYYRENGAAKTVTLDQKVGNYTGVKEWTMVKNSLILHKAARGLGYANAWHMLASDRKTTGMKQIAYLLCVNKPGRSYADDDQYEFLFYDAPEYAMMYASHAEGNMRTTSADVAHELFHLFGAEDYYKEGKEREKRSQLALQLCPTDVMLCTSADIWQETVGGFTAYTVGWLEHLPEEYKVLGWWR